MLAGDFYFCTLLLFCIGGLSTILTRQEPRITNYVAHSMALFGCIAAIVCATFVFGQGEQHFVFTSGLPFGSLQVGLDRLSAFFLMVIGIAGSMVSLYAYGYSREYYGQRYSLLTGLYNLFLLSMVLVVTVAHAGAFIISWEIMSVISFFLVNHEYEHKKNSRAAYLYLVMTHVGTVFVITAFLLLAVSAGSMSYDVFKHVTLSVPLQNIVFLCAVIGFGTKAGLVPLHIWLPQAHPAAPTHVSALMSGVMLKTAVYGMCRFFLEFLGIGPVWWGTLLLAIGIITAVLGALYAFIEHDIKRLLAYSSVENMGIIILGLGAGLTFMSMGQPVLAGIAFIAGLYHVLNHSIFKSLAFMGAGAVLQACHTKDMEHLGGLIKRMPYTAVFSLVGAVAISALPPLNGFVSEWLLFQSLFFLPQVFSGILGKVFSAILIALLGMVGALAAACFVEAFGITFLAKPRSHRAEIAREVPLSIRYAMGIGAILCLGLGVYPHGGLLLLKETLNGMQGISLLGLIEQDWYQLLLVQQSTHTSLSMGAICSWLLLGLLTGGLLYRLYGREKVLQGETWTCGIVPDAKMEYTASGFSKSIRRVFSTIVHPQYESLINANQYQYHGSKLSYRVRMIYLFSTVFYKPINEKILRTARFAKRIQTGSVQLYVGYIFAITVVILAWSTRW